MSIKIKGFGKVKQNLTDFEKQIRKRAGKALAKATTELENRINDNISLTDHTLYDLARMGHPYALRNPQNPHDPHYLIHKQGGLLKSSLFSEIEIQEGGGFLGGDIMVGKIGLDENKCPYARYVIMGTSKMVSRDVLTGTMNTSKNDLEKIMKDALR